MQIHNEDVLVQIRNMPNNHWHTLFSDFPYFLGTEWHYVNGVLQMKGAGKDFMSGWSVNNADWWREYLKEVFRTCKYEKSRLYCFKNYRFTN